MPARMLRAFLLYAVIGTTAAAIAFVGFVAYRTHRDRPPPVEITEYRTNPQYKNVLTIPDGLRGWVHVPGAHFVKADASGARTTVIHDSRGLRVGAPDAPEPDRVDLLAIGCSQTWGQGVEYEQTFTYIAGQHLGWTVANAGVSSYGSASSLLTLRMLAHLKPKVVVYGLFEDHIRRNLLRCVGPLGSCLPVPGFDFDASGRPYLRYIADKAPGKWSAAISKTLRIAESLGFTGPFARDMVFTGFRIVGELGAKVGAERPELFDPDLHAHPFNISNNKLTIRNPERYDQMLRATIFALEEMKAAANSINAQLVVVYIPNYFGGIKMAMPQPIEEALSRLSIPVVDATQKINRHIDDGRSGDTVVPKDGHISPLIHAWIGERLADTVRMTVTARR